MYVYIYTRVRTRINVQTGDLYAALFFFDSGEKRIGEKTVTRTQLIITAAVYKIYSAPRDGHVFVELHVLLLLLYTRAQTHSSAIMAVDIYHCRGRCSGERKKKMTYVCLCVRARRKRQRR